MASISKTPDTFQECKRTDRPPQYISNLTRVSSRSPAVPWLQRRERGLLVQEYLSSYLRYFDTRRFQISPAAKGNEVSTTIRLRDRTVDVSTRDHSWTVRTRHMSRPVFDSALYANPEMDTPFFRFPYERIHAELLLGEINQLKKIVAADPRHVVETAFYAIDLSTWVGYHEDEFFVNPKRWNRDLDTEWRVAELTQNGHHTSFLNTEYWNIHPSLRDLVFPTITAGEPRLGSSRVLSTPTARPYIYFGRYFCPIDTDSHDVKTFSKLNEKDDHIHQFLRAHIDADPCRNEFGRFLIMALYGPEAVFNQLGDCALHINYDRFRGILCPLIKSWIQWVNYHTMYEILKGTGLPVQLVTLAYERTQLVDWTGCKEDGLRIDTGYKGLGEHGMIFFRYDYNNGNIDDLPVRRLDAKFDQWALSVPVRLQRSS